MHVFKSKFVFLILCVIFMGCSEPHADENIQNMKRIKIGMSYKEVRSIMGKPDTFGTPPLRDKLFYLEYSAPSLYSGNFIIYFNVRDSMVNVIDNGL